jgi:hypothetical protein
LATGNNSRGSNTGSLVGTPVQKSFKNLKWVQPIKE